MEKRVASLLAGLAVFCLANLSQQRSVDGKHYPEVNFQGTIQTRSGTQLAVENILIAGKYKQIPVYEAPTLSIENQKLSFDPSDRKRAITSYLDLAEVKMIRVDNPTIWTYQREKGYSVSEFVEIIVVSSNARDPEKKYLTKLSSTITCDEMSNSGPIEKVIPFTAITTMAITDFASRDANAKEYTCMQECRVKCRNQQ